MALVSCKTVVTPLLMQWSYLHGVTTVLHWVIDIYFILDTDLASCIDMSTWVTDGDSAHHLAMVQGVDLTRMSRYPRPDEGIRRKRDRLHLTVSTDVEWVSTVMKWRAKIKGLKQQPTVIIESFMQERHNSIANALELHLSRIARTSVTMILTM